MDNRTLRSTKISSYLYSGPDSMTLVLNIYLRIGRLPVYTLVMFIVVFCVWDLIFWENDWMRALGVNGLQLIAGILSFTCLFKAYRSVTNKQRYGLSNKLPS